MPKSRIPSPARSTSALATPRSSKRRGPRSVGSPARSNSSVRLTSVIQNFKEKNMDSFRLSPLNSRRSVLNDNTDIEEPGRRSWWRKLNDTSRDILEVLDNDQQDKPYNVMEEYMDVEVLSQEKKNKRETLDRPDSSDSESISSIVIPQRKLFTQKENQPKNKFAQFLGTRESMAISNKTNIESDKNDKTIVAGTKKLFGESSKPRSKPAFPTELLRFSPEKTVNKTAGEVKGQVRNLFGNRAGVKRKNKFADFIASESEDEPEIQPKVFGFQKIHDAPARRVSTASSLTADIDMEDWKLLPSSTMVQTQLEAMMAESPVKKAKLSKLSEAKETETATNSTVTINKTKQSNKSVSSKDKSITSKNSFNKSKMSPEVNKSASNDTENKNNEENEQSDAEVEGKVTNMIQKSVNTAVNKSKESNKSVTLNNKSKINSSKNVLNKTTQKSVVNEGPEIHDQNELDIDEVPNDIEVIDKSIQSKSVTSKNASQMSTAKSSLNKSKTSLKVNKSVRQWIMEDAVSENEDQDIELQFDIENREAVTEAHLEKKDEDQNNISNRSNKEQYNKSVTTKNKSKTSNVKHSFNKSKTSPQSNKNENQEMDTVEDDIQMDKESSKVPVMDHNVGDASVGKDNSNKAISSSKETFNKSKTTSKANDNENLKSILNKAVPEKDSQEMEVDDDEENRLALTYSDEEPIEQEKENLSENVAVDHKIDSDAVNNSQEVSNENVENDKKIINESLVLKASEQEDDEEESPGVQNESIVSRDKNQESEVEEEENQEMDESNKSHEIEMDDPAEIEEDNEVIDEENVNQEVETENEDNEEDETENDDNEADENEEDENEEEIELEEEDVSQQDQSQEVEESHEVENEEGEASEDEEVESQEINNDSDEGNEVIDESDGQNGEGTNEISGTEEETPNITHDVTGRNRKKNETDVKSPEAILRNDVVLAESYTVTGRNTSIRTIMPKSQNRSPSLAPPRESTGFSDGTRNSSAEGSGWDSHRTTRKTLRQTFGRDFTPRKSLRALVMEKSAKRHTVFKDMNEVDMPRANSTELPEDSNRDDETVEDPHEISKRTRQTTLEMYLQKIKKQNMEQKKKLEEEVRSSLTAPPKDILNPFKVPARPFVLKRATKPTQGNPKKKTIKSTIPVEFLPPDLLEDMCYKPPRRFQPSNASWITKRLYKFLETKLEPKYDYKARVRAEKLVETIYNFVKDLRRHDVASIDSVDVLKQEMARLCIVNTHFEFYQFFHDYLPREVRVKVVPDVVNKLPLPRNGVFTEILRAHNVQG